MRKTEEYTLDFSEPVEKKSVETKREQRFGIFEAAESVLASLVVITLVFTFVFRVVSVDGPSMKPTLQNGDKLLVSAWGYEPKKGDVVVLSGIDGLNKPIVKRIIAVGGDVVDINFTTGVVTVNALEEDYSDELTTQQFDIAFPLTVPEGCVFVLGDNRPDSLDSRSTKVGCIDERSIVGKVQARFFPLGKWTVK